LEIQNILTFFKQIYITPITVGIVFYYAEKEKLDMQIAESLAGSCYILTMSESTYKLASKIYNQKDLEDAMQVACAKENNVQTVLTLDKAMANKYKEIINFILL